MPCLNNYGNDSDHADLRELANLRATLCAVFRVLEEHGQLEKLLKKLDYKEAGLKRKQITSWYAEHKALDDRRRAQAVAAAADLALIASARSKLTEEELKALTKSR